MKHLYFLVILLFGLNSFCQTTYLPDDNFEQKLILLGYDDVLDNYVLNANISNATHLQLEDLDIYDLTGIEGFTSLEWLDLSRNFLTSIDVSQNQNLEQLDCSQINTLVKLNIQNGNNENLTLGASYCPNLSCVQVDDIQYVIDHLNTKFFFIDSDNYVLGLDCFSLATEDFDVMKEDLILYPNPSIDFISILGIPEIKHFKIYNSMGSIVKFGVLSDDKKIDIINLSTGLYFLKFDKRAIKFIKE